MKFLACILIHKTYCQSLIVKNLDILYITADVLTANLKSYESLKSVPAK